MKANAYVGHNDFLLAMLGQCSVSISSAIQLTCEAINIHRPVSHWKIPPPHPPSPLIVSSSVGVASPIGSLPIVVKVTVPGYRTWTLGVRCGLVAKRRGREGAE
jgi:hypothetical protein